jgi:hypothetical protein
MKETKPKKSKSLCSGCYNNDYNHGLGGSKECWSFKDGKIIKRIAIPVHMRPPYDVKNARYTMNCFNKKGYCYVKPENLTKDGFWR